MASSRVPHEELSRLQFLLGEHTARLTVHPPDGGHAFFAEAAFQATWESSDRYLHSVLFLDAGPEGHESAHLLMTHNDDGYCVWSFSLASDRPTFMCGGWDGDRLVLRGEVAQGFYGLERARLSLCPLAIPGFELTIQRWTPDGWGPYVDGVFVPVLEPDAISS